MTLFRTRVMFAIPSLSRGGAGGGQGGPEGVFATLLREIDTDRFEPLLVVHDAQRSNLIDIVADRARVISLAGPSGSLHPHSRLLERYPVLDLVKVVRASRPHIVLSTLRMNATVALAKPLLPRATRFVARVENNMSGHLETQRTTSTGPKVALIERLQSLTLRSADQVIAQSPAMRDDLRGRFGHKVGAKTVTLPNPVDIAGLQARARMTPSVPLPSRGTPQLVSVGRLHRQKGYDLLLPAFQQLLQRWPKAGLWLIGEGPDRAKLETQAVELGLQERIQFLGFISDPAPHVRAADVYVCSSRYEGFSNAMAEALALGTPAVASAGPAGGDDLITADCGIVVPSLTAANLADGMDAALRREFDPAAISASCQRRFSASSVTRRYESLLDAVAGMVVPAQPIDENEETPCQGH